MNFMTMGVCCLLVLCCAATGYAEDAKEKSTAVLESEDDKVSYAVGMQVGQNMLKSGMDITPAVFFKAIEDVLAGREPALSPEDIKGLQSVIQARVMAAQKRKTAEGTAEATTFLAENAKKEGVVELESGLQYLVLEEGTGATPGQDDTVQVHYTGWLLNGDKFDSSHDRGEPAKFPVTGVIKGWTEALKLMKEGGKWKLFVPPDLAYGERGRPGIPPNALLTFEVELIEIEKGALIQMDQSS